jgi:8-oxo-dGTP pyrophosphatase MutT (NUDIX family)
LNELNRYTLPEKIKQILNSRPPVPWTGDSVHRVHAAVLMPLFYAQGEYRLLFIRRSDRVEYHKGQISFPGGSMEETDRSFQEAALREAAEEVGIRKGDVDLLGRVDDTVTVSTRFVIHPFIGLIPHPYDFVLSRSEVSSLIEVPLGFFFEKDSRTERV